MNTECGWNFQQWFIKNSAVHDGRWCHGHIFTLVNFKLPAVLLLTIVHESNSFYANKGNNYGGIMFTRKCSTYYISGSKFDHNLGSIYIDLFNRILLTQILRTAQNRQTKQLPRRRSNHKLSVHYNLPISLLKIQQGVEEQYRLATES